MVDALVDLVKNGIYLVVDVDLEGLLVLVVPELVVLIETKMGESVP
jgi:hypothetical protein